MAVLEKLSTEYIEAEDRFRISGENAAGQKVALWLTQRLLLRMLGYLISALEEQSVQASRDKYVDARTNALVNEISQERASQEIPGETPVVVADSNPAWLVTEVDINRSELGIALRFRNNTQDPVDIGFNQLQLRQWLAILHQQWLRAEWPVHIWPEWIQGSSAKAASVNSPVH